MIQCALFGRLVRTHHGARWQGLVMARGPLRRLVWAELGAEERVIPEEQGEPFAEGPRDEAVMADGDMQV